MPIKGVNHITLAVTDLRKSVSFYCDLLGGRLRADWPSGAYIEIGSLWLCLTLENNVCAKTDYTHIAFDCPKAEFDCKSAQIQTSARLWKDNTSEGNSLYFMDPDGHKLELHSGTLASRLHHYATTDSSKVTVND